ncbi:MAG: hypothetical protein O3B13_10655 [Planctomycetota bacterium]|nr:hypothetical protein [Planctomycetota bacterium]
MEWLAKAITQATKSADEFTMDDWQVPCLKSLISWSRKQFDQVHPQLVSWLASVRQQLKAATAHQPTPPTDAARPADVTCNCQYCGQLNAFLADSTSKVGRIPAREDLRQHLIGMIDRHQCDVAHSLERKGSPFSLVLTKTTGS